MNRKVEKSPKPRVIEGTPNEKLFTIAKFHETRLKRIEKFLAIVEQFMKPDDTENARIEALEENLNVAFDSLQNVAQKVENILNRNKELEKKIQKMGRQGSSTKLAVMGEHLRLLASKVGDIESAISTAAEEDEEGDDEDEGDEAAEEITGEN